jgi:tRNA dimethylallyltransferase
VASPAASTRVSRSGRLAGPHGRAGVTPRWIAARAGPFDAGLVEEARALRERFDPALPCFTAIGYHESWAFLDGELTLEDSIALDARRNVAFAKRQRTWFRAEPRIR